MAKPDGGGSRSRRQPLHPATGLLVNDAREMQLKGIRPVWIASYPRSGNTFLRIVLQNVFRCPTYSLYHIEGQNFKDPSADPLEEAPKLPANWRSLLREDARAKTIVMKTHDAPDNDAPAIYIVRDGRAAIHSYFHYHQKFSFEQPSLTEVIAGACQFGDWSTHYRLWHPKTRHQTLFLKYEDLVNQPAALIPQLAQFLELKPTEGRLPTFEELRERFPAFFRRGQNSDFLTEWTPAQMALFNLLHGPVMTELGYALNPSPEPSAAIAAELAGSAARLHKLYLEQLANFTVLSKALEQARQETHAAHTSQVAQIRRNWWLRLGLALRLLKLPDQTPLPDATDSP